ncbi:MAG TPA: ATP-binding protein [Burkholderiaceae bacterium]|nr:ATP-binding protein [Burkholderiaceae bacterium]
METSILNTGLLLALGLVAGGLVAVAAYAAGVRRRESAAALESRTQLDVSADWFWRSDAAGVVLDVRPGRRPATVARWSELRGRESWQLGGPPAGDAPGGNRPAEDPSAGAAMARRAEAAKAPAALAAAMSSRVAFFDVPVPLANGRVALLSGAPLWDDGGACLGFAGTGREAAAVAGGDAVDPGASARQAARIAHLEAEQSERTRELELAVKDLDSFAHSVSHDLRAPLRVVDGFANIVLEDYGSRLDDLGRDHLRRIVAAGQRMNSMIDTLLALSRTTNRELQRERVDLSRLASELAEELARTEPSRTVQFEIEPGVVADGDRTLLQLVLQNLLGNAFKFTAKANPARIEFGYAEERGATVYFVRDNGAGFDMRFAEKLFGLFQRFHAQREFPGTGVGLATVQRIVHRHGGRVWAQAEPGRGATFSFTLWEGRG